MAWFFRIFLGIVAVCVVLALIDFCRNMFAGSKTCDAVVVKRYTESFPLTIGFVRKDRTDRHLVFRTVDGQDLTLTVLEEAYKICPVGTKCHISYRGHTLTGFVLDPDIEIEYEIPQETEEETNTDTDGEG